MVTQRWPTAWLMTDERMGDAIDAAIAKAARSGAGIIVRHHRSTVEERASIARQVIAAGALLGVSRDVALAEELGAALVHNPEAATDLPYSLSIHDEREAAMATERAASLVFVSPVFPTRSHPEASALGVDRAAELARLSGHPAIGLGGLDEDRGRLLLTRGFAGWAGIDCWLRT